MLEELLNKVHELGFEYTLLCEYKNRFSFCIWREEWKTTDLYAGNIALPEEKGDIAVVVVTNMLNRIQEVKPILSEED